VAHCGAMCCSVVQGVVVCCCVLQCAEVRCSGRCSIFNGNWHCVSYGPCVAVRNSVLQCVAVCYISVVQYVAVCCSGRCIMLVPEECGATIDTV